MEVGKFLKENKEYSPGMTYYTGNWGQDLEDNLTPTQRKKLQKQMEKLSTRHFKTWLCLSAGTLQSAFEEIHLTTIVKTG